MLPCLPGAPKTDLVGLNSVEVEGIGGLRFNVQECRSETEQMQQVEAVVGAGGPVAKLLRSTRKALPISSHMLKRAKRA